MVPSGWERKALSKIAEIRTGIAKGKKGLKDPIEVPYLRVANVQDGHLNLTEIKTIKIERHQLERYSLKIGDVLMTEGGDFDKLGRGDVWQGQITPCLNQNHVFAVRTDKARLLPYFLAALSSSNYGKTYFLGCAKRSTNLASINSTQLKEFPIPLPPLPEQQKIAQILSTWDKAISTTESLIANSQQQKKALMQKLLTGKKRFAGFEAEFNIREGFAKRKLGLLPVDWRVDQMPNHYWFQEGPGVRKHQFTETGIKLFNGTNIQKSRIRIENTKTHISKEEAYCTYNHFLADEGDLVIACSGISVDKFDEKIAFIEIQHLPLCMNTSTMRFKVRNNEEACIHYLRYYMMSNLFKDQIRRQITGSAQLNFGPSHVNQCFIVLPTFKEQQKISSTLIIADKEVDTLQQKLTHLKQEKKALMQQLLTGKRRVKVGNKTEAA